MSNYKIAEDNIKAAFEKFGVVNDVDAAAGDTLSKMIKIEKVGITGSPDAESLPGGAENPANANDRFDAAVKIEDLRELNEPQIRKVALKVLQDAFSKIPMQDGKTLADRYDFSGTPAGEGEQKLRPIITVNTSVNGKLAPVDILNILVALPEGITHSQVVASMAGKALVQQETVTAPAEATPEAAASVPAVAQAQSDAPKFASENLKAPLLTANPPAESAVDRLKNQPPSSLTLAG